MLFATHPVGPAVDTSTLAFDVMPFSLGRPTLVFLEKDKGGTGSTGTAMTLVEQALWLGLSVHIVDLAATQLDLAVPYSSVEGVTVHAVDRERDGEDGAVLRAMGAAGPGEIVLAQFPGNAIDRIDQIHAFFVHVQSGLATPIDMSIIWTMDADRNSRDMLGLVLDTPLPGTLHVNWPQWNGEPDIAPELAAKVTGQGGKIVSMPPLDPVFYRPFKTNRIAPRTLYLDGDFVTRAKLDFWHRAVAAALGTHW